MSDTPEAGLVTSGGFRLFDLTGLVYDEGAGLDPLLAGLFEHARRGVCARIAIDAAGNGTALPNSPG
ncbi:hypothetical protein LJR230_004240 [Trinickia sp. LjRoot230]|uniref:hypothetical protein n=1 Tax=Trinickia sp. LjRoot230 TaxID=3342288 RepID=UPI003ED0AF36